MNNNILSHIQFYLCIFVRLFLQNMCFLVHIYQTNVMNFLLNFNQTLNIQKRFTGFQEPSLLMHDIVNDTN